MGSLTQIIRTGDLATGLATPRAQLTVSTGPDAGKTAFSSAERFTLGVGDKNDLVLTDSTVSRIHAEILRGPDGYRVRDLESTNGTFVNGVQVVEAFLPDGGSLRVGSTTLRFALLRERDQEPIHPEPRFGRLVGQSVTMRAMFAKLARLAATQATVLIQGESGTGKELVAEALHQQGARAAKPFIILDCGAIPSELVESELFGHEKGAFTGATTERRGAFEAADGGTLFLDEIGELPLQVQPKLLRALERRQIKRVGADQHRTVDVRFIAATHRDLKAAVNRGTFREDLYFRLAVATVHVPALREHVEDLPFLLEHLWNETTRSLGLPPQPYVAPSTETLRQLSSVPWEGNVRELRNFVERGLSLSGALDGAMMPRVQAPADGPTIRFDLPYRDSKEAWVDHFERAYLSKRLADTGGNVSQLSREAEIDRAYLIKLLKKHAVR